MQWTILNKKMHYTLEQIAKLTSGTLYGSSKVVGAVSTDSRATFVGGSLFVALVTPKGDGHRFVEQMIDRGCRSFLVSKLDPAWASRAAECGFILVNNTLDALQSWASHHRSEFRGTVVGITGSNGKTVVKEWFAQLWNPENGTLAKSPRSYNSQLGVALSLLSIEGSERVAVIEAGISEPKEMERLEAMIRPDIGVLTNLGDAHGEHFLSADEKLNEKLKLFANAKAVIRGDLAPIQPIEAHNLWLVAQIYRAIGIDHLPIDGIEPVALRLEVQQGVGGSEVINDSYNSDLQSIATALDFQRRTTDRHERVLVLSDVVQSALAEAELYNRVADLVREAKVDKLVGIGATLRTYRPVFEQISGLDTQFYGSTTDFLTSVQLHDYAGSSILLKGSRAFAFERISRLFELRCHTTTLEVNLSQLIENLTHFQSLTSAKTLAMVKASSYGAGTVIVAKKLVEAGVSGLAVAFADEGVTLRQGGITAPIVVLNSDPGSFATMIQYNLEPEIYSFDSLDEYERTVRREGLERAPIHLKLDTGMHRLGFMAFEVEELCRRLKNNRLLEVRTIFSHLAASEDPAQDDFTRGQIKLFNQLSSAIIETLGLEGVVRSLANTAGIERFPEAHYELVRLGIGLYKNAGTLRTRVVQVKWVEAGETVGYNRRWVCKERTRLAIIPIGYADGMDRRLSNGVGRVAIHGVLCPVVGNVCMDTTMVDVTGLEAVGSGDDAVVFGRGGQTPEAIAARIGTIDYELLTSISPRIKRIYTVE